MVLYTYFPGALYFVQEARECSSYQRLVNIRCWRTLSGNKTNRIQGIYNRTLHLHLWKLCSLSLTMGFRIHLDFMRSAIRFGLLLGTSSGSRYTTPNFVIIDEILNFICPEINLFWSQHQVHHSSEEYNLSTALRQAAFQGETTMFFYLPMALLIPPTQFIVHGQFKSVKLKYIWNSTENFLTFFQSFISILDPYWNYRSSGTFGMDP